MTSNLIPEHFNQSLKQVPAMIAVWAGFAKRKKHYKAQLVIVHHHEWPEESQIPQNGFSSIGWMLDRFE